ncbi:uncharacterized protein [Dermacentor albipictus]|uniref:uncharacterized protein isoform X1 n=1 Tax=Dermacentor albipictus TaxID=60249 RepID=UPI0038FC660A
MTGSIRQGEEVCLSSAPFSVDDDSPGDGSPDGGSPAAMSMAPSSRGSRSCNTVSNDSPVRQVISPPPGWRPSSWSPSRSAPDLRIARPAGTVASPYTTTRVLAAATASGPARAKSPFWLTSPDSIQPHPQQVPGTGEAVESQPQPPGSGDREDLTTDNHHTTAATTGEGGRRRGGLCFPSSSPQHVKPRDAPTALALQLIRGRPFSRNINRSSPVITTGVPRRVWSFRAQCSQWLSHLVVAGARGGAGRVRRPPAARSGRSGHHLHLPVGHRAHCSCGKSCVSAYR